jgi:hypothetical protein
MLRLLSRTPPSLTRLAIRHATTTVTQHRPRPPPPRASADKPAARAPQPARSRPARRKPPPETARPKAPPPAYNEDAAVEFNAKEDAKARRWARLELPWLQDKVQLAERVDKMLRNGQHRLALELVRLASRKPDSAVMSWNLLLKFHLTTNKAKPRGNFTMKLFSEVLIDGRGQGSVANGWQMKQRNQTPDAYTYNILLWGLSVHPDAPWALAHATKLYQRMTAPGSKAAPNQVNTHLLLQLCGRAGDLDALWEVVGAIPETGAGAASATTYAVILNSLRGAADGGGAEGGGGARAGEAEEGEGEELYPRSAGEVRQAARNKAADSGRRVWAALLGGWRAGAVKMDAQLVFSMGRLLMLGGRPQDRGDLFKLAAQTIGVSVPPVLRQQPTTTNQNPGQTVPADNAHFDPSLLFAPSPSDRARLARPSNHILSLLLDASATLPDAKVEPAATHYWSELTGGPSGLTPDTVSLKKYLHVLSRARCSARAARALQEALDKRVALDRGAFRAAFAACLRNARGGSGLRDAAAAYAVKRAALPRQDPAALDTLLRTVDAGMAGGPAAAAGDVLALLCADVAAAVRKRELASPEEVEDLVVSGRPGRSAAADERDWPALVGTLVGLLDRAEAADLQPAEGWREDKAVLAEFIGGGDGGRRGDWFVQTPL